MTEALHYGLNEAQIAAWKEGDRRIYNVLDTIIARLEQDKRVALSGVTSATQERVYGQAAAYDRAIEILTISRNAHTVVD